MRTVLIFKSGRRSVIDITAEAIAKLLETLGGAYREGNQPTTVFRHTGGGASFVVVTELAAVYNVAREVLAKLADRAAKDTLHDIGREEQ